MKVHQTDPPPGGSEEKEHTMTYVNEAGWDRILRVLLGVALLVVGFAVVGGTLGVVLGVVGLVPLITGLVGYCPLYRVLHIRTNRPPERST
jgi:hypothetical protein